MRWTVRRRLFALSVVLIALAGLVAGAANWGLQTVQAANAEKEAALARMLNAQEVERDLAEMAYAASAYTATAEAGYRERYRTLEGEVSQGIQGLLDAAEDDRESQLVAEVQRRYAEFSAFVGRVVSRDSFNEAQIRVMSRSLQSERNKIIEALNELLTHLQERVDETALAAEQAVRFTRLVTIGTTGAAVLFGFVVAFFVARNIVFPVLALARAAQRMAAGDLSQDVTAGLAGLRGRDELAEMARSFHQMVNYLRGLVVGMQGTVQAGLEVSGDLAATADQAALSAQDAARAVAIVAEGTSQQAASAQEMNRMIEELRQSVQQIAAGASRSSADLEEASTLLHRAAQDLTRMTGQTDQVARGAQQAAQMAAEGSRAVDEMVQGMTRIEQAVGDSAARMDELAKASAQIGQITAVISEIADQTNLLALNAAIEAARAGEHGRGFAVVADEVRKLAERSAASAREISELIARIQARTDQVVESMTVASNEVQQSTELAARSGRRLEQILQTVTRAAEDVSHVAEAARSLQRQVDVAMKAFEGVAAVTAENTAATEEMAEGTARVLSSIGAIVDAAQQNAAAAEQVSAAIEELTAVADGVAGHAQNLNQIALWLKEQVSNFQVGEGEGEHGNASS